MNSFGLKKQSLTDVCKNVFLERFHQIHRKAAAQEFLLK